MSNTILHPTIETGAVPVRKLPGGEAGIPALGLGTWELLGDSGVRSIQAAADAGYRHFDTARAYDNERDVARALRAVLPERASYWLTSKAWHDDLSAAGIRRQADESLRALETDYLDLLLLHWRNEAFDLEESLHALAGLAEAGKIRFFGVSNFTASQWREAIELAPAMITNQVEYHPYLGQDAVLAVARERSMVVTAYSPLAHGEVVGGDDATLESIGRRHGKSAAQVALRWLLDQPEVVAIPRSSSEQHLRANLDVFDFELSDADREAIDALPKDRRQIHPEWAPAEWGPVPTE